MFYILLEFRKSATDTKQRWPYQSATIVPVHDYIYIYIFMYSEYIRGRFKKSHTGTRRFEAKTTAHMMKKNWNYHSFTLIGRLRIRQQQQQQQQ